MTERSPNLDVSEVSEQIVHGPSGSYIRSDGPADGDCTVQTHVIPMKATRIQICDVDSVDGTLTETNDGRTRIAAARVALRLPLSLCISIYISIRCTGRLLLVIARQELVRSCQEGRVDDRAPISRRGDVQCPSKSPLDVVEAQLLGQCQRLFDALHYTIRATIQPCPPSEPQQHFHRAVVSLGH